MCIVRCCDIVRMTGGRGFNKMKGCMGGLYVVCGRVRGWHVMRSIMHGMRSWHVMRRVIHSMLSWGIVDSMSCWHIVLDIMMCWSCLVRHVVVRHVVSHVGRFLDVCGSIGPVSSQAS